MAHTARHEVPVAYLTGSNGDVHLFLNEIDDAVVVLNLELQVRVPGRELRERRHQQMAPERHWHVDPQPTLGPLTSPLHGLVRVSEVRERQALPPGVAGTTLLELVALARALRARLRELR